MILKRSALAFLAAIPLVMVAPRSANADAIFAVGTSIPVATNVFAVPITIADAVDVIAWQFDVTYDAANVQIYTDCDPFSGDPYCSLFSNPPPITEGDFFSSGQPFNAFNPGFILLDNITLAQLGQLIAVNNTLSGSPPGVSGAGVLAYVEFITIGTGLANIAVTNASATSPATVPEPATLALVASGVVLLGARRLRGRAGN